MKPVHRPLLLTLFATQPACTTMTPDLSWDARCARDIEELHQFFEDWFQGKLPDTDEAFASFEGVLHPEFHIVVPSGETLSRDQILALVRKGHGRWAGSDRWIEVRSPRRLSTVEGASVFAYEEWQVLPGSMEGRVSTVVLRPHPKLPGRIQWVHVHETPFEPGAAEAGSDR